jgi:hypothetical protein
MGLFNFLLFKIMQKVILINNHSEEHVTWEGLLSYGCTFLKAYRKIEEGPSNRFYPVNYYLLGHALELFLKGGLRKAGYSIKKLEEYGHNLELLIKQVNSISDFSISEEQAKKLTLFNDYYRNKELEYFGSQGLDLTKISDIEEIVVKYGEICGVCSESLKK